MAVGMRQIFSPLVLGLALLLGEQLQLPLIGTLRILLKAKRAGLISAVRPLLDAVQQERFRMGPALYDEVLNLAEE